MPRFAQNLFAPVILSSTHSARNLSLILFCQEKYHVDMKKKVHEANSRSKAFKKSLDFEFQKNELISKELEKSLRGNYLHAL